MGQHDQGPRMPLNRMNPNDLPNCVCECGHDLWETKVRIKFISRLINPKDQDEYAPFHVSVCAKCGTELLDHPRLSTDSGDGKVTLVDKDETIK